MNTFTKLITTILVSLAFSSFADVSESEELQYDSEKQASIVTPTDPYLKWQKYLSEKGIREGANNRSDGSVFLIAYGSKKVGKSLDDSKFMNSRTAAFVAAELDAKSIMTEYLSMEINSNRSFLIESFGNEVAPPLIETVKPLSIMDKASKLTGLALDNEIKKFDPEWDGTNKTDADRNVRLAEARELVELNLSSKARAFLQGTTPIFNAEGPDDEGHYTVVVGLVWSPRSTLVAESVYNPTSPPPLGPKKSMSIAQRLDALSDEEIAGTLGLRIWWDEEGQPIIMSFGQAKGTGSSALSRKQSGMIALGQVSQFVAEQIASENAYAASEDTRYFEDGAFEAFDDSKFQANIVAYGKTVNISGISTVLLKKIYHPITNKKIVVNVMSWSPESNKLARELLQISKDQETKMDATQGGKVFNSLEEASDDDSVGTVATSGLEGVSSDPDDF
tara:strand:- start:605 stop:1951 length:1347 start_codon:yes stop_codon:yes gene_type:complete